MPKDKKNTSLEPFDKSLDKAEKILEKLVHDVELSGKIDKEEFYQKTELVKIVCNYHSYKTKNMYLMARTIKELDPNEKDLLRDKIEKEQY